MKDQIYFRNAWRHEHKETYQDWVHENYPNLSFWLGILVASVILSIFIIFASALQSPDMTIVNSPLKDVANLAIGIILFILAITFVVVISIREDFLIDCLLEGEKH